MLPSDGMRAAYVGFGKSPMQLSMPGYLRRAVRRKRIAAQYRHRLGLRCRRGCSAYSCSPRNDGYGAHSGPSRGDLSPRAYRPFETSAARPPNQPRDHVRQLAANASVRSEHAFPVGPHTDGVRQERTFVPSAESRTLTPQSRSDRGSAPRCAPAKRRSGDGRYLCLSQLTRILCLAQKRAMVDGGIFGRRPGMARKERAVDSVAEAYLTLLAERGVEYLFANSGTDFAPLIEAFAKAARTGAQVPKPILATHENLALSMAHGWAMVTGRVPAVMLHVSVGTANGVCGVFNAARDNVPIFFTAGRSPLTKVGAAGDARCLHPLGAGDVRPSRHGARAGQMGLRAEKRRAARKPSSIARSRLRRPTQGAGLPVAAARGAGRAAGRLCL